MVFLYLTLFYHKILIHFEIKFNSANFCKECEVRRMDAGGNCGTKPKGENIKRFLHLHTADFF